MNDENPYRSPQTGGDAALGESPRGGRGVPWFLFSFRGRIPRRYHWAGLLGLFAAMNLAIFVVIMIDTFLFRIKSPDILDISALILAVPYFWIDIALHVKRLHDRNRSALWMLFVLVPVIGLIWLVAQVGFLRGTIGPNRFGEDPT